MTLTILDKKHLEIRRGQDSAAHERAAYLVCTFQDNNCAVSEEIALELIALSRLMSFSLYKEKENEILAYALYEISDAPSCRDDLGWLSVYTKPQDDGRYYVTTSYDRYEYYFN